MAAAQGVCIHHIARGSADVKRLAKFYQEVHSEFASRFPPVCFYFLQKETETTSPSNTLCFAQILGFERVESPNLGIEVVWLRLPPVFTLHLIQKDPESKLPETPWNPSSAVVDPKHLTRSHHICFSISNYESFVQTLKVTFLLISDNR